MYYTVRQDYESETFYYGDSKHEGDRLAMDIFWSISDSPIYRAEWEEDHLLELDEEYKADGLEFTAEDADNAFIQFCQFSAEDACFEAERTGRAFIADLTIERHEGDAPDDDDDSDDSDDGDPIPAAPAAPAAVLDPAPAVTYYHEPADGMYHAVRHFGPGLWGVALNLDQATGDGRTYAFRPTKAQCLAVLRSLAPAAVELPGLPAWLR